MGEREPEILTVEASEARQAWTELLRAVSRCQARVVIERSGTPMAAIVSADDLAQLEKFEAERRRDVAILEAFGKPFKDAPDGELKAAVANAVSRARAEHRSRAAPAHTA